PPALRPDPVRAYATAVKALRRVFPKLAGPADLTEPMAHEFKEEMLARTFTRGKASDAKQHDRKATTCATYLRSLRSLWSKHFKALRYVKENPWREVPYPNLPKSKRVRVPQEEDVNEFFAWLEKKHPGWEV